MVSASHAVLLTWLYRREATEMIGVNETTIYNWESNKNPPSVKVISRVEKVSRLPPFGHRMSTIMG